MTNWIEVLRTGEHTASSGRKVSITPETLTALVANYDPAYFEAPLVVGHPKDNAPAYGWVESLKAEGGRLFAKFKQVHDGFREAVRSGAFKNRSVAFYNDLDGRGPYLRHVGFLGAAPPAVKGLEPLPAFSAAEFAEFDFSDCSDNEEGEMDEGKMKTMFETFQEKMTAAIAKLTPARPAGEGGATAAAIAAAVAQAKAEMTTAFSEQVTALRTDLKATKDELAAARSDGHSAEVAAFVEKQRREGKWAPAWDGAGIPELMESLEGMESIELSEGSGDAAKTVKKTPLAVFQQFMEGLPKIIEFGELTASKPGAKTKLLQFTEDARVPSQGHELADRAEKISREQKIEYGEALRLAAAGE